MNNYKDAYQDWLEIHEGDSTAIGKLCEGYTDYKYVINENYSYKRFLDWVKTDLVEEQNIKMGVKKVKGVTGVPTRMNLAGHLWLQILAEMKHFGVRTIKSKKVKEYLHSEIDQTELTDVYKLNKELIKDVLSTIDKNKVANSRILFILFAIVVKKADLYLNIDKEGNATIVDKRYMDTTMIEALGKSSILSISLTYIIKGLDSALIDPDYNL
jgi:hypothetical protein